MEERQTETRSLFFHPPRYGFNVKSTDREAGYWEDLLPGWEILVSGFRAALAFSPPLPGNLRYLAASVEEGVSCWHPSTGTRWMKLRMWGEKNDI